MTVRPLRPVEPQADDDSDDEAEALPNVAPTREEAIGSSGATKTEGALPAITTTPPPPGGSEAKSNSAPRDPERRDDVSSAVEGARASSLDEDAAGGEGRVNYRNRWVTMVFAVLVWLFIAVMNVANLALLGLGK